MDLKYYSCMGDESENCSVRFRLVDSNLSKQIDPNDTNFRPLKEDIMRLRSWLLQVPA